MARVTGATIRDVRSVFGSALRVPLDAPCTVLVGPNRSGSSTVLFALAAGLDDAVALHPPRDLPHGRRATPGVSFAFADDARIEVTWDPDRGDRRAELATCRTVVYAPVTATPRDLLRGVRVDWSVEATRDAAARAILDATRAVVPEAATADVDAAARVEVRDALGIELPVPGVRALAAAGIARFAAAATPGLGAVLIEAPDAFLHPAAQEDFAAQLCTLARELDVPVVVATSSPFVIPRTSDVTVLALARDADGRTGITGTARGDRPHARLLGGLFPDPGVADVLDRTAEIGADTRAVLVVEGGTDEAYLREVARRLGRVEVLDRIAILPAGGAMPAALETILLRAETRVPVYVLLDHDDAGRRARDTLVSRFGFTRARTIVTYADVLDGGPPGVEAETLFDATLLRRFVAAHGPSALAGERHEHGVTTVDLTSSGKSAFVGWLSAQSDVGDLARWDALLTVLADRFDRDGSS